MAEQVATEEVATEAADQLAPPTRRVLVIDDDPTLLELMAHALGKMPGYVVFTAVNGADGLARYFEQRPDCVIVDVVMPVMDGYQFLRALRGDRSSAQTPVIILSGKADRPHQETGELSGTDEYMVKPFKPSELCAVIERVMRITPEQRERRLRELAGDDSLADGLNASQETQEDTPTR
jgi:two-component system alkaline phosphatase synthesis response regulator PhoP